jgi:phosphoribosylformimino-5-aminoimidazole carboxamide ribotide isomerase
MTVRVIPVLDVQAGCAVHAIGGDRAHYRPLQTRMHPTSDPLGVAGGFRDILGLRELYLADLDAIDSGVPCLSLYQTIRSLGTELWVDAGIRDRADLHPLLAAGVKTLVIGLETIQGPAALTEIVAEVSPDRLVFSLDMRDGLPLIAGEVASRNWDSSDPFALARSVIGIGIRRLLLLDLSRVGTTRGIGTLPLLSRLRGESPGMEITVGGGIAGPDELKTLEQAGANAVLVGTAIHDGRIGLADFS